mgnify:CR=1 FL=1
MGGNKQPVVFWSDGSKDAMKEALGYIKRFSLTMDDVGLKQNASETIIYAKRDISGKLKE